ncbi:MAG: glycine cleavage system aminomethyltransferase GcvT [Pseudomonadota bacterium]
MVNNTGTDLKRTHLYDAHVAAGARIVSFAGYAMPVHYRDGILAEHVWTRKHAGLFDVSHMGIAHLRAEDGEHETVANALETLVPADIQGLAPGQQRYTQLTNEAGGIIDDMMVARSADPAHAGWLYMVVNAARKMTDYAHIGARLPDNVALLPCEDFALLALQGPQAIDVMAAHDPRAQDMAFMSAMPLTVAGLEIHATRSGYTGEDGFELPVPVGKANEVWAALSSDERVKPIGLGARDSLRLEAGLCLYGHDIDETTSPVEAGLTWSIQKRRRQKGGFPGDERILNEIANGPERKRVGIRPDGRAPAREGTVIQIDTGEKIGAVTSGGYGPTCNGPVAMGYIDAAYAEAGTKVSLAIRGKAYAAEVVSLPFVHHRYKR